ncbi:sec-independent protein translocase protein TatA [Parabacteroides sp. PF5-5]|nr:sec-independent protein translocase protein TatA [Parabacteroides sp. PH5-39]MDH6317772.1 sec-independent protein translocase protein TatA [Parabacteroides sp. PF5-13]MDH6320603.1 sec-independent protein translocase protein TatA [Parabacteroides sp. PH5-13]MDH6324234.1 sec-independent protein translocase protein TatA [Parabacteroides sp. PH5-8]MDH6328957.1 sec-independent protein translocase protein TatA [Parabacteroides sp. PH5-41]MDH6336751.1 sec-independent protein translocase protein Ta
MNNQVSLLYILYICRIKQAILLTFNYNIMTELLFLGNLGTGEIVIIAIIVLLLFGGKKIPELMKGIGKGVKNFKDGVKGLEDDIKLDDTDTSDKK